MHLWILRPRLEVLEREAHPWTPPFDKTMAILVRAETEDDARRLAQTKAGHEGQGIYQYWGAADDELAEGVWLGTDWTTCDELVAAGEPGVILVDRREA
jgi:hypothetical protein